MCWVGQGGANHLITQVLSHGIVKTTNLELAITHVTINQMEKFIKIFAHYVWLGAGRWGIQKKNAHTGSKITRVQQLQGAGSGGREIPVTEATGVTGVLRSTSVVSGDLGDVTDEKAYKTRFFYNSRVVPSKVNALLTRKHHKCEVLSLNTVRSRVFNKTAQQVCNTSLGAGRLVSKVTHNDFSYLSIHSNRGDVTMGNDIDVVEKISIHNPATNKTPGFESGGPGFESLTAGYESSEHETNQSSSGYVSRNVVVEKPTGHGFESSQVNDLVISMNQEVQESCEQNSYSVGNPDLTLPKSVGPGFDSCVKEDISTSCLTSVNAVTDKANQLCPIYDVNNVGMEEKFVNTIIFANQGNKDLAQGVNIPIFNH